MQDITSYSIDELLNAYKEGFSVEGVVDQCLMAIDETENEVHALLHVSREYALEKAREYDKQGFDPKILKEKPLFGVPVTIKDALCTKDIPTTAGSHILKNFLPPYSATAVKKLEDAGAIIIGKNNMDEFAMGSTCENSAYYPTKNPHDTAKVPGGSSGGSAASVVAKQCFASLGTDTGGSIRQPSNLCGCVGMKPTYGRVSRYGVIAYASSLDQVGPLARSVKDTARVLQTIAGYDEKDSTSSQEKVPNYLEFLEKTDSLKNKTFGIPKEFLENELDSEVLKSYQDCIAHAKDLGANVVELSLPHTKYSLSTYYIIAMAEAGSNLARYDGVRFGQRAENISSLEDLYIQSRTQGFGEEVQRRILIGAHVLSSGYYDAYYKKAAQVRRLIREDYTKALEKCDALIAPVSPIPAWNLKEVHDPIKMYLMDIFTLSLNLAGLPGIAIPRGLTSSHLPLGVQLLGRPFDEGNLLAYGNLLMNKLSL